MTNLNLGDVVRDVYIRYVNLDDEEKMNLVSNMAKEEEEIKRKKRKSSSSKLEKAKKRARRQNSSDTELEPEKAPMDEILVETEQEDKKKEREALIDDVDEWIKKKNKTKTYQPTITDQWKQHFKNLVNYKRKYGHCSIPLNYEGENNNALGRWVKRQRYNYKLYKQGKTSSISADHIDLMEEIGFIWDAHGGQWQKMYEELLDYKENHGNCNVPTKYQINRGLATWVNRQRVQHRLLCEHKTSSMTEERLKALNKIGFRWEVRQLRRRMSGKGSDDGDEDSRETVPEPHSPTNSLATWFNRKRSEQKRLRG